MQTADVVIVGGGVMGCSTAYFLAAEHSIRSVIVGRDVVASGASGGAAGEWERSVDAATPVHSLPAGRYPHARGDGGDARGRVRCDYLFSAIPLLRPALDEEEAHELQEQMGWQREVGIEVERLDETQVRSLGTWLTEDALGAAYTIEKQPEAYPFAIALAQACERRGVTIRTAEVNGVLP